MFGIGGQELLLILVLALILLGPSKLPDLMKTLGKAMGEFQRASSDFQREIEEAGKMPSGDKNTGKASGEGAKADAAPEREPGKEADQPQTPEEKKGQP
jgi:Tat protein translocase TatB subunit